MNADFGPLRAWLAAHPSPDEPVGVYQSGPESRTEDGHRVISLGYFDYGPAIDELWTAIDATDWDATDTTDYLAVTTRWQESNGVERVGPADVTRMDRATLLNQLRWIQRGERFCDGHWAAEWQAGTIHAAARALLALG